MRTLVAAGLACLVAAAAGATVITSKVDYRDGDVTLEGFMAADDAVKGARPGVLIIHQWMGPTDYERGRARQLAEMGYVAFVADVYGQAVRPKDNAEASALAAKYKADRLLLRSRVVAALDALKRQPGVDPARVAAIGYCFGGTAALELARSGADLAGVVTFHGGLDSPNPADGRRIKAKILVLHGADDPFVPATDIAAFQKELRDGGVDWQMVSYGGAVHSFTQKGAGDDPSRGAAFNERAERRSWQVMKDFFAEIFAKP